MTLIEFFILLLFLIAGVILIGSFAITTYQQHYIFDRATDDETLVCKRCKAEYEIKRFEMQSVIIQKYKLQHDCKVCARHIALMNFFMGLEKYQDRY